MNKRALASIVLLILAFAWGYLAAAHKLFPYRQIEAARAYFAALTNETPQPSAYWLEKSSFFEAFGARASVVVIGDSITDGAEWGEMFPGAAIANRGIDGDTTHGGVRRTEGSKPRRPGKSFIIVRENHFC